MERIRFRHRAAFGLIALPIVGSAFALPAVANATDADDDVAAVEAFYAGAYSYDDAVVLADRWTTPDPYQAKVKAGGYLKQGVALADSPHADPTADDGLGDDYLTELFLASGHTVEDAAVLAEQWGVDVGEAKARAGGELKTVGVLPFVDVAPGPTAVDDLAVTAFFDAGYSYADAVALSHSWVPYDPYQTKIKAGGYLKQGIALVDSPYADATAADDLSDEELADLFLASGHTAEDAAVLAAQWGVGDDEAKALAGRELKTVGVLPFVDVAGYGS